MCWISVIVPVYNVEKYIQECIESVLNQDFEDFELILIDDGSPDQSGEICERYAKIDSRITVVHKTNGGLSSARNRGMEIANGEYVLFLDSDDFLAGQTVINKLYRMANMYKVDMLLFSTCKFFEKTDKKEFSRSIESLEKINNSTQDVMLDYLIKNELFAICAWARIVRRNFLIENKIRFDENTQVGEDFEWTFEIYHCTPKTYALNDCILMHRIHNASLCGQRNPIGWKSRYALIQKWKPILEKEHQASLLCYLAYQFFLMLGDIHNIDNRKDRKIAYDKSKEMKSIISYSDTFKTKWCEKLVLCIGSKNASIIFDLLMKKRKR